mmetsp:Transcript_19869/g.45740  ORF Transcript_19869/g.45740 Transcript_19869/m.45740 type:complete len:337 (+) Transcript_19869:2048-3058(+)
MRGRERRRLGCSKRLRRSLWQGRSARRRRRRKREWSRIAWNRRGTRRRCSELWSSQGRTPRRRPRKKLRRLPSLRRRTSCACTGRSASAWTATSAILMVGKSTKQGHLWCVKRTIFATTPAVPWRTQPAEQSTNRDMTSFSVLCWGPAARRQAPSQGQAASSPCRTPKVPQRSTMETSLTSAKCALERAGTIVLSRVGTRSCASLVLRSIAQKKAKTHTKSAQYAAESFRDPLPSTTVSAWLEASPSSARREALPNLQACIRRGSARFPVHGNQPSLPLDVRFSSSLVFASRFFSSLAFGMRFLSSLFCFVCVCVPLPAPFFRFSTGSVGRVRTPL